MSIKKATATFTAIVCGLALVAPGTTGASPLRPCGKPALHAKHKHAKRHHKHAKRHHFALAHVARRSCF